MSRFGAWKQPQEFRWPGDLRICMQSCFNLFTSRFVANRYYTHCHRFLANRDHDLIIHVFAE